MKKISYEKSGVDYRALDPAKKLGQEAGLTTAKNLKKAGFVEITDSRGETAYVWDQGNILMASVVESLGTKNLVADETRKIAGKTYYDVIGHDAVAAIINDLIAVGAKPLETHAFWAVGDGAWFNDQKRTKDLVNGWKTATDLSEASWGGGESPSLNSIVDKNSIVLGGSAVGIIKNKKQLITDKKLKVGDRIILLKSNGINCNGLSLARAVAKKLKKGYGEKLSNGQLYGEAILSKTNIYAKLIQDLLSAGIDIHYISNITGHGLRKIMRARGNFTYVIEKLFPPQEVFLFIQKHAGLSDDEIYQTLNMGQDYAIFVDPKDVKKAQVVIKRNKFESINAGYIEGGPRQVIIKPKNIKFTSESLDLR